MILALFGGFALSLQAGINGTLGRRIGTLESVLVSFTVGTLVILIVVVLAGNGALSRVSSVPKWQLIGGGLGVFYLLVMTSIVPKIGIGAFSVATIASQMALSMIFDHYGVFSNKVPFDSYRMVGLALMVCALFLIFRGSKA